MLHHNDIAASATFVPYELSRRSALRRRAVIDTAHLDQVSLELHWTQWISISKGSNSGVLRATFILPGRS